MYNYRLSKRKIIKRRREEKRREEKRREEKRNNKEKEKERSPVVMISILVVGFTSALVYERYIVYVRTLHKRFDPVQDIKK